METKILRVVRQGEAFSVQSAKAEGGQIQKCNIVLKELGGSKFENEYVCAMLGNLAACRFCEGDVVVAAIRKMEPHGRKYHWENFPNHPEWSFSRMEV